MKIDLEYYYKLHSDEFEEDGLEDYYNYSVDLSCQDVVEYKYKEKYGKDYNPLSWYLEDGAREFVKGIEDAWLKNEIDEYAMLQDLTLRDFLKEKYQDEVCNIVTTDYIWYLKDLHNGEDETRYTTGVWCEVE